MTGIGIVLLITFKSAPNHDLIKLRCAIDAHLPHQAPLSRLHKNTEPHIEFLI